MTRPQAIEFCIDHNGLIQRTGLGFERFAFENGAVGLCDKSLLGRSLMDFIRGRVSREYTERILQAARSSENGVRLNYRCDSPDLRRYNTMSVEPLGGGALRMVHQVMRVELRQMRLNFAVAEQRARDTWLRCSVCNRLKYQNHWFESDTVARLVQRHTFRVIYGICVDCDAALGR